MDQSAFSFTMKRVVHLQLQKVINGAKQLLLTIVCIIILFELNLCQANNQRPPSGYISLMARKRPSQDWACFSCVPPPSPSLLPTLHRRLTLGSWSPMAEASCRLLSLCSQMSSFQHCSSRRIGALSQLTPVDTCLRKPSLPRYHPLSQCWPMHERALQMQ